MVESDKKEAENRKTFRERMLFFAGLGLRGRLMAALIPSLVCILLAAGLCNYSVSSHYINVALERFVRLQNLAVAHEVERFLELAREDLLFAAHGRQTESSMRQFLAGKVGSGGIRYLDFSYIAPSGNGHICFVRHHDRIERLDSKRLMRVVPNPLLLLNDNPQLEFGQVWASPVMEVEYPLSETGVENAVTRQQVIRFVTPYHMEGQAHAGVLMLSVCATDLRDILTLYNSEDSPLWAFPRSSELRYDYMIDPDGWMLFQSAVDGFGKDSVPRHSKPGGLSTYLARSGYEGTLGRPGLRNAFRPNSGHEDYWRMLENVREGESGLLHIRDSVSGSGVDDFFFAYAPVWFNGGAGNTKVLYGGLVRVDRSILPIVAGYQYLDVMLVVTVLAIMVMALLIYWLGRKLTSPIRRLSDQLNSLREVDNLEEVDIPYGGRDIDELKNSVNALVRRISRQMEEIREKDEAILNVNLREPADLSREQGLLDEARLNVLPDIIGTGTRMAELRNDVLKAAGVDVDVLVTGETGTGKQLVAEAIHGQSRRHAGPFISINCGALDENLLLDALFGHVKGAFTEARGDRNGAFLEAGGGTLFLDEIQSASPRVQQSLLRALSIRKIKPLGSDVEIPVDVRIIAATNVDLSEMIEEGTFREDLYYRLKVVSINSPALRDHPENIPLLALHYLRQAEQLTGRSHLELSRGAVRKLSGYSWPGNIRELVNSITRAVVMAETDVIEAEEIRLEGAVQDIPASLSLEPGAEEGDAECVEATAPRERGASVEREFSLNPRQQQAWEIISKRGGISRSEYQDIVGGDLSPRTANYDLNEFVSKGLLVKVGKGPATRYVVAEE